MTKHLTSTLTGALLDAAVAQAQGMTTRMRSESVPGSGSPPAFVTVCWFYDEVNGYGVSSFRPSTDWADGGPIIERERIELVWDFPNEGVCSADIFLPFTGRIGGYGEGPTPLVAAMRAFVESKLGEEVDL